MPKVAMFYNVPPEKSGVNLDLKRMASADLSYQMTEGNSYKILKCRDRSFVGKTLNAESFQELKTLTRVTREQCAEEEAPAPAAPAAGDIPVTHRFMKPADDQEEPEAIPTNPAEAFVEFDPDSKTPPGVSLVETSITESPSTDADPRQVRAWKDDRGRLHESKFDSLDSDIQEAFASFKYGDGTKGIPNSVALIKFLEENKELLLDYLREL